MKIYFYYYENSCGDLAWNYQPNFVYAFPRAYFLTDYVTILVYTLYLGTICITPTLECAGTTCVWWSIDIQQKKCKSPFGGKWPCYGGTKTKCNTKICYWWSITEWTDCFDSSVPLWPVTYIKFSNLNLDIDTGLGEEARVGQTLSELSLAYLSVDLGGSVTQYTQDPYIELITINYNDIFRSYYSIIWFW